MSNILALDIETFGGEKPDVEEVKVPASYKKPESIQKYKEEHLDEYWRSLALDKYKCQVIAISVVAPSFGIDEYKVSENEKDLIQWLEDILIDRIGEQHSLSLRYVTFNGNAFDLPILALRALKYGNNRLFSRLPTKKWSEFSEDLFNTFKFTDYQGKVSLAKLLEFFSLEGKGEDMTGSMVHDAWLNGEHDKIGRYCLEDSRRLITLKNLLK